jgi:hypothetical protein
MDNILAYFLSSSGGRLILGLHPPILLIRKTELMLRILSQIHPPLGPFRLSLHGRYFILCTLRWGLSFTAPQSISLPINLRRDP